jgi:hemerythrin
MFEWKPEYSVQIPSIDAQHQRLFALAEELHVAMSQGKAKAVLEQSLAALVDYTKAHFAAEEQLMNQYHFPDAADHKIEHEKLTSQVLSLQKKFRAGEKTLSITLMVFLKNWLENHIAGSDQQYSRFIRGKAAA